MAVTVMSDLRSSVDPRPPSLARLVESATFCRLNDNKRPALVGLPDFSTTQMCPADLTKGADTSGTAEGAPPVWYVRVIFDKLLDPTIEDLVDVLDANKVPTGVKVGSLANTKPVTLTCNGVEVMYGAGSYYVPNGNSISYPNGPSLFIQPSPSTSVPTGATCEVKIKDNVHNKRGESVPADQRTYAFKIAPMKLRFSSPDAAVSANGEAALDPSSAVRFFWTAALATLPATTDIKIFSGPNVGEGANTAVCGTGGTAVDSAQIAPAIGGTGAATTALRMDLKLNAAATGDDALLWVPSTTYRVEFATTAKVTASQGGDGAFPANYKLCFHTKAAT